MRTSSQTHMQTDGDDDASESTFTRAGVSNSNTTTEYLDEDQQLWIGDSKTVGHLLRGMDNAVVGKHSADYEDLEKELPAGLAGRMRFRNQSGPDDSFANGIADFAGIGLSEALIGSQGNDLVEKLGSSERSLDGELRDFSLPMCSEAAIARQKSDLKYFADKAAGVGQSMVEQSLNQWWHGLDSDFH